MDKFAFLIHPRDIKDIKKNIPVVRILPDKLIELIIELWGFSVCSEFEVLRNNKKVKGYLIWVGFTSKKMMESPRGRVQKIILKASLFAQNKLGASIIGLGALTTSVTEGGMWLVSQPGINLTVTHGDTYAAAVSEEGIEKIFDIYKFTNKNIKVAIVGAYGIIGREITSFLAKKGYSLVLIEKSEEKVNLIKQKIEKDGFSKDLFIISTDLSNISQSDLVVATTSHHSALLKGEHLKRGAIVYDIAQPENISSSLLKERPDLIKIDGGYVNIGDIDIKFNLGTPKGIAFGCLVETIMMALEREKNHHVGEIKESYVAELKKWAKKYGFHHASFTAFGKPVSGMHKIM
ncbi:MAG: SDR family NAD(P)-dependent oxidoreductase [bacterium]